MNSAGCVRPRWPGALRARRRRPRSCSRASFQCFRGSTRSPAVFWSAVAFAAAAAAVLSRLWRALLAFAAATGNRNRPCPPSWGARAPPGSALGVPWGPRRVRTSLPGRQRSCEGSKRPEMRSRLRRVSRVRPFGRNANNGVGGESWRNTVEGKSILRGQAKIAQRWK